MAMFDPNYVTEVLNDILSRRGLEVTLVPANKPGSSLKEPQQPA